MFAIKDTCLRKQSSCCRRRRPHRHWGATRQRRCSRGRNWPPPPGRWPAPPLGPQLWGHRRSVIRGVQWSGKVSDLGRSVVKGGHWLREVQWPGITNSHRMSWSGKVSSQKRSVIWGDHWSKEGQWCEEARGQGKSVIWGDHWSKECQQCEKASGQKRSVIRGDQWPEQVSGQGSSLIRGILCSGRSGSGEVTDQRSQWSDGQWSEDVNGEGQRSAKVRDQSWSVNRGCHHVIDQ